MGTSLLSSARFALVLALLAAAGLLLYELVGVIEVLALALLIALILAPAVDLLVYLRFPRILALLVVLAGGGLGSRATRLHSCTDHHGPGGRFLGPGARRGAWYREVCQGPG